MRILWTHNFSPVVLNAGNFMHSFAAGMRNAGVEVDLMYLGNLRSSSQILRARAEVRERSRHYDLVHAQFGSACALVTSAALVPKIVSLRGSDWHRYKGINFSAALHGVLAYLFSRWSLQSFDAVVTMSVRMTNEVVEIFPNAKVITIPDPINVDLFRPRDRNQARIELFGSAKNDPWVLFTTLSKSNVVKRIGLAEDAIRIARQRLPGLEIRVATGIPHAGMPMFVSTCNVALCTSMHEGWPNSIKEALACGMPFVSTDVSDLGEIASRHSTCHISPANPEAIAECLVQSLTAPRDETLRLEAEAMDLKFTCQRLMLVYKSILK